MVWEEGKRNNAQSAERGAQGATNGHEWEGGGGCDYFSGE